MKATHELSNVTTALSTLAMNHRDEQGVLRRPEGKHWDMLTLCMHRLFVLRGMIPAGVDRLPGDPWELFLDEFGRREAPPPVVVKGVVAPSASILASSASAPPVAQEDRPVARRVRFAPQEGPTRGDGESRSRSRSSSQSSSRSIPRWVS